MSEQVGNRQGELLAEMRDEELQLAVASFTDMLANRGAHTELGLDEYVDLSRTRPSENTGGELTVTHVYAEPFITEGDEPETVTEEERFVITLGAEKEDYKPVAFSHRIAVLGESRQIRHDKFALYEKYQSGEFASAYSNKELAEAAYKEKQYQLDIALQNAERRRAESVGAPIDVEKQLVAAQRLRILLQNARMANAIAQTQAEHDKRTVHRY